MTTKLSSVLIAVALCVVPWAGHLRAIGVAEAPSPTLQQRAATDPSPEDTYQTVLRRYCVGCHNERTLTAGLALDTVDLAGVGEHAELWEKVVRKLRTRAMPPPGRPKPSEAEYEGMAARLETAIDAVAQASPNPGRRPAVHRLNRAEYANAVRDLLALEIDTRSLLPADDSVRLE